MTPKSALRCLGIEEIPKQLDGAYLLAPVPLQLHSVPGPHLTPTDHATVEAGSLRPHETLCEHPILHPRIQRRARDTRRRNLENRSPDEETIPDAALRAP